jgi:hypothetical protein
MNPWKVIALGMALMMATALAAGLVVARWSGADAPSTSLEERPVVAPTTAPAPATKPPAPPAAKRRVPSEAAIITCIREAVSMADKTVETIRDAKRYREAYASCLRARGYTT